MVGVVYSQCEKKPLDMEGRQSVRMESITSCLQQRASRYLTSLHIISGMVERSPDCFSQFVKAVIFAQLILYYIDNGVKPYLGYTDIYMK